MKELFPAFKSFTEEDYKLLWEKATFVFDTNVLLDLYRLPVSARTQFISLLGDEKIKNRMWLPFQAAMEVTYNTKTVVSDQKKAFKKVREVIEAAKKEIQNTSSNLENSINKLNLSKRHPLIEPKDFTNPDSFKDSIDKLNQLSSKLDAMEKEQPDIHDEDEIIDTINEIFASCVGRSYPAEEYREIIKVGEDRYKKSIPPGYMDSDKDNDKPNFHQYKGVFIPRKLGDFTLWKQLIDYCRTEQKEYIIFVTGDIKEHWWQKVGEKTTGPK
jgi:hypothetical protein